MQITLTIPDENAQPLVDGICRATGYVDAGGVTKEAWTKSKLIEFVKSTAKRGMQMDSADTIKAAVDPVNIT
jgi:hypothetical protein